MQNPIDEKYQISPFFIVFLIYVSMVGVGILNFQHSLVKRMGNDSWMTVLLLGISIHLIIWMIYKILLLKQEGIDITHINTLCFGKIFGSTINVAIILYFYIGAFIEFRAYNDVVQVWVFPEMNTFPMGIVLLFLIYYTVSGGFRSVTGLSFWGMLISYLIVIPFILLLLPHLHPQNLMSFNDHSMPEVLSSFKSTLYIFMGFEAILVYYPFIKTPEKSQKWAHVTVLFVTSFYLLTTLITLMFFNVDYIRHLLWPTLTMLKIIQVPILQRLEYLAISVWLIKILANISLGLWVASRGMLNTFNAKRRSSLLIFLIGMLIAGLFVKDYKCIRLLTDYHSTMGMYFLYIYIPIMFFITRLKKF
jgi:spore germination protein (amino acid permease)